MKNLIFSLSVFGLCVGLKSNGAGPSLPMCEHLLREIGLQIERIEELDLNSAHHRFAVASLVDLNPGVWKFIEDKHPQMADLWRKSLFIDLQETGPLANLGSDKFLDSLLQNVGAIQLENHCRVRCPWCGFSHNKPAKYKQMPVQLVRTMLERIGRVNAGMKPKLNMLYYESDPFNYHMPFEDGEKWFYFYPEIHRMAVTFIHRPPYISTAVPKGMEAKVLEFVAQGLHTDSELRISVSEHNQSRLKTTDPLTGQNFLSILTTRLDEERKLKVQKLDDHLMKYREMSEAELKVDLLKSSEIFKTHRYRLAKLDPREPGSLLLKSKDEWILRRLLLRKSIDFDPETLRFYRRIAAFNAFLREESSPYIHGPLFLYDVNIQKIGRSFDESETGRRGIGCFNGVLITPTGVFNVLQLPEATQTHKDGQIVVEIDKASLHREIPQRGAIETILSQGIVKHKVQVESTRRLFGQTYVELEFDRFSIITVDGKEYEYELVPTDNGSFIAVRLK